MNSCAAFCCTFCRADSSVSGTSASSLPGAVASCFRCASNFLRRNRCLLRTQHHLPQIRGTSRPLSGPVHCVAALCFWSSALPLLRSSSVLHPTFMSPEMPKPIRCPLFNAFASGQYLCTSVIFCFESAYFTATLPCHPTRLSVHRGRPPHPYLPTHGGKRPTQALPLMPWRQPLPIQNA